MCIHTHITKKFWDCVSGISSDYTPNAFEKYFPIDVCPLNRGRNFSCNPWEEFRYERVNIPKERLNYKGACYGSPWKH